MYSWSWPKFLKLQQLVKLHFEVEAFKKKKAQPDNCKVMTTHIDVQNN